MKFLLAVLMFMASCAVVPVTPDISLHEQSCRYQTGKVSAADLYGEVREALLRGLTEREVDEILARRCM